MNFFHAQKLGILRDVARQVLSGAVLPSAAPAGQIKRTWMKASETKTKQHMKKHKNALPLTAGLAAMSVLGSASLFAGEIAPGTAPLVAPSESALSGSLSLDFNTHFVSYGWDVWQDGASMSDPTFNPSLNLTWQLTDAFSFNLGTWWDVNSKADSAIGGRIQEVDVWAGVGYTLGGLTTSVTYQAWMYGSDTEEILDVKFAYDTFLSPSLTIHSRLDEGASGGQTGTVLVAGIEEGFDLGPVSFTVPLSLAYFMADDFHPGSSDEGFGYASLGLLASYALPIDAKFGEWALKGGFTYYLTDDDVVGNPDEDNFLTASLGVSVAF
jgi:hypothetical protein